MSYQFSNNKFFVNPYTFVEGSEKVDRTETGEESGNNTGVFTCRIYPKTPLLIPDAFDKEKFRESVSD